MTDGAQLPVQNRNRIEAAGAVNHVVDAEITVRDGDVLGVVDVRRHVVAQPAGELVHRRDFLGLRGFILARPAPDLPRDVVLRFAIVLEPGGPPVDPVKAGEGPGGGFKDAAAVRGGQGGQGGILEHPAFDKIHHVKHGADDAVVVAEHAQAGNGNFRIGERLHDAEFAVDRVGRGQ